MYMKVIVALRLIAAAAAAATAAASFVLAGSTLAADEAGTPDAAKIDMHWGVKIPLRDGVQLDATLYTPKGQSAPAACIVTLTPYIAQTYHDRGVYFATHGWPFLTIDVRGRGNSDGEFHPFIQEAKDGYDAVEWLAKQNYCNGKVGMWGGSYAGYDQWATAKERPPHLATILPAASAYPGADFPYRNNITSPYMMQWLLFIAGHTSQFNIYIATAIFGPRCGNKGLRGASLSTTSSMSLAAINRLCVNGPPIPRSILSTMPKLRARSRCERSTSQS
jgi:predicted acyl esterase